MMSPLEIARLIDAYVGALLLYARQWCADPEDVVQELPELNEMFPGNPIQNYLKCFGEQQHFFYDKEETAKREKYMTMPLKELPAQELVRHGGIPLRQADWAARLDKPDWDILLKAKTEGVGLLLPELQQIRMLANTLKVRMRAEVALQRYDDALRTAKTVFAMSRHFSEHPTIIGALVGMAIGHVGLGPVEEMLEQPGCPNLYWAVTALPSPLVPLDKAVAGERLFVGSELSELDGKAPLSARQITELIAHVDGLRKSEQRKGDLKESTRDWLDARARDEKALSAARRRLVEAGFNAERLAQFPAHQVLLLDEKRECETRRDEVIKLMNLEIWQAEAILANKPADEPALLDVFVPALAKIQQARGRLDQRIALLRHVEALRLYAAAHERKLPEKLTDCTVPLPPDPFTGRPFKYTLEAGTAHLRGTPPRGQEHLPQYNLHYEVTIRK